MVWRKTGDYLSWVFNCTEPFANNRQFINYDLSSMQIRCGTHKQGMTGELLSHKPKNPDAISVFRALLDVAMKALTCSGLHAMPPPEEGS
jgi:hypothetical protein